MTFCRACRHDYTNAAAFDRHRVGRHDYTLTEGLRMEPLREDGRRCLDADEMIEAGMELDRHGRWRIAPTEARRESLKTLVQSSQDGQRVPRAA
jgi:hypothetical protein